MDSKLKKNITCIIIDDEKEACDRLESLFNKIPSLKILAKELKADNGIKAALDFYPDIIFLDIEMPDKSGFDVVKAIRRENVFPTFIFVTGYDQYAIKAIRNAAFDYLLKPVDIDELREAIKRYIQLQNERQKKFLPQKLKSKYSLTDREIEIVKWLLKGKTSKEIAEELFISKHTVDTHRRNILGKVGVKSTGELMIVLDND